MVDPLKKPPKKNPQKRTLVPTMPPVMRSRASLAFSARAAEGRLMLQTCSDCGHISYPPREACPKCWSLDIPWTEIADTGRFIAETILRTSTNVYFRERMPWRIGTVQLDAGPTIYAHIHGDVTEGDNVRVIARTDKAGQGVMMALPPKETPNMADDPVLRQLTCSPKHRRVLITDGRTKVGQLLAKALSDAGASIVFVGIAEDWRPFEGQQDLKAIPNVQVMPLDITDTISVDELVAEIGGKVDILINTASYVRPGSTMARNGIVTAQDEMEINYFGLMRLIQAFGPAMMGRGADGDNSACAWVNLLSVYALSNWPSFGTTSASQAAAYSLSQCLRGEFLESGIKVINTFFGPLEDEWYQPLPPPKVAPERLVSSIVNALEQGIEDVIVGDIAKDFMERWKDDPRVLEKELTQMDLVD